MKNEYKEALQKQITIYWWNLGTKTLDHKGTYGEFFKKKEIKISEVKHPNNKEYKALKFNMPIGSSRIIFYTSLGSKTAWDYAEMFNNAIKLFLTYLGDKTLFYGNNREFKINWR